MHFASSHARGGGPGVCEFPRALGVEVGVVADVVLVATQGTLDAQRGADEIVVALTKLVLPVVVRTHDPRKRSAAELAFPGPAHVGAAEFAVQVDHAPGARRRGLRGRGNRQVLNHIAMAVVTEHANGLRFTQIDVVNHSALLLLQALARVEQRGHRSGLVGVGVELGFREAQGILRIGPRDDVAMNESRLLSLMA